MIPDLLDCAMHQGAVEPPHLNSGSLELRRYNYTLQLLRCAEREGSPPTPPHLPNPNLPPPPNPYLAEAYYLGDMLRS